MRRRSVKVQAHNPIGNWKRVRILLLGVGVAVAYWLVDSVVHSFLFHECSFSEAFLSLTPREIWMRLLPVLILLVSAFILQSLFNKQDKAERTLRENEEKFRRIFESAGELIGYVGEDGRILDVNPKIEEMLGYKREELVGKKISELDIYPEGVLSIVMESFGRVVKGGPSTGRRVELRHKDGRSIFVESSTVALQSEGEIEGILFIMRDVTERARIEDVLRESEKRYRHLMESITDAVTVVDREWRQVLVNSAAERFLEMPKEKLLGTRVTDALPGVEKTEFFKTMQRVMETREPAVVSGQYSFESGRVGWYEVRVYPAEEGILCITTDITERVQAEEKLRVGEDRWDCLTSNTDDTIIIADRNRVIEYINKPLAPHTFEDVIGKKLSDFVSKEHHDLLEESLRRVFEEGEPVEYEVSLDTKKFSPGIGTLWFSTSVVPMTSSGVVSHAILIATDITERKKADEALRESEKRLLGIINSSPDPILVCDVAGTVVQCNEALLKAHGLRSETDLLGQSVLTLIASGSRQRIVEVLGELPEQGVVRDLELTLLRKDGTEFPAEISAGLVRDQTGRAKYLVGVAKDVTKRRKVERELWDATEKWTSLMENTSDIITVMDRDGRVQYTNRALAPLAPEETIGRTMFEYIGKEQHGLLAQKLQRVFETGETQSYEMRSDITGVGPRWFSSKMIPVKHDREVVSVITIASDITERKRVEEERERLRQQLAYAEKMESLGHLARGVAHEINNPLTSVLATAELILDEMCDENVSRSDIEQIVREARRIQDTIRSFLGFAKARDFVFEERDINAIMETALMAVGKAQLRDCEVVTDYDDSLGKVKVSRFHIQEVFVNIIANSLHSMRDGGKLTITTGQSNDSVVVTIKDTGAGIRAEDLDRIFEPYFTTREKRGTGLGLSICRDIVMRHGGKIEVRSEGPGRGAEFKVFLPR